MQIQNNERRQKGRVWKKKKDEEGEVSMLGDAQRETAV